ncbi:helix-turn-helix domain-containing protein [Chitinophaga alhagiae]|uniref:helix-turn-helix domain-containing protein n=1 Tax=Chitinophaga alhagiae TaxID=2203219 RepID=UPI000E5A1569|nr:AraC family transcriptional regulator [Chitinophaga alhagiae]
MHLEAVTYEVAPPCKALEGFVSHFWCSRWHAGVQQHFSYHATACTTTELAFAFAPGWNRHRPNTVFSSVQGHTENHSRIDTGGFSDMFGVSLHSYAVPFFFNIPASRLTNQLIDLDELIPGGAAILADSLARGRTFPDRVEIMTQYLKAKWQQVAQADPAIMHAIRRMRGMKGSVSIRDLAGECSLSQKQFERRFRAFSSFTPKLYARILRFESSLGSYKKLDSLTDVAHHLGYYDQAHFINDFKKFSGFSPRKYMAVMPY